jgi:hypothetical protein
MDAAQALRMFNANRKWMMLQLLEEDIITVVQREALACINVKEVKIVDDDNVVIILMAPAIQCRLDCSVSRGTLVLRAATVRNVLRFRSGETRPQKHKSNRSNYDPVRGYQG